MELFKVIKVFDGNTFQVEGWNFQGQSGVYVKAAGYNAPKEAFSFLPKQRLERLILYKYVELGNVYSVGSRILYCDVFLNGSNLSNYFPEYKAMF
jgi:hypothetical protein